MPLEHEAVAPLSPGAQRVLRPLLLLLVSVGYLYPTLGRFSNLNDEGFLLAPVDRVLHGQRLYRDIYMYLPPLSIYYFAAWFKCLGISVLASSLALCFLRVGCVLALYRVGLSILSPGAAMAGALSFLFLAVGEPGNYNYHWAASFVFLLNLVALLRWQEVPQGPRLGLAGLALAVTGWTYPTFFIAMAVTAAVALTASQRWRQCPWLVGGLALGGLPPLLHIVLSGDLSAMLDDVVRSNLYRRPWEYVSPVDLAANLARMSGSGGGLLTVVILVATTLVGAMAPLRRAWEAPARVACVYAAALMMVLVSSYRLMPSNFLLHGFLMLLLCWGLLAPRAGTWLWLAFLPFLALGWQHFSENNQAQYPVSFPRGVAMVSSAGEASELQRLVRFLQVRLPRTNYRAMFTPYVMHLYFLMDVQNPTPYDMLRAVQFSPAQHARALALLGDAAVFRFPVYDSAAFVHNNWPNADLSRYQRETDDFYARLLRTHTLVDNGAVQVYSPPSARKAWRGGPR